MKRIITSFTFLILLPSSYTIKGMWFSDPLSEAEKLIVLHKIEKLGKATVLDMIESKKDNKNIINKSEYLPTVTKIRKNRVDDFAIFIINSIKTQEKQYTYIPEQISKKVDGIWHITIPTNYFGNYTRYWHKKDNKGEYIELRSTFTYKPSLLEIVNNY